MSSREWLFRLDDILTSVKRIEKYITNMDFQHKKSSLRALQKAWRSNPVLNFKSIFKELIFFPGLLRFARNDGNGYVFFASRLYK